MEEEESSYTFRLAPAREQWYVLYARRALAHPGFPVPAHVCLGAIFQLV